MPFHLKHKLTYFMFCAALAFGVDVSSTMLDPCECDSTEQTQSDASEQEDEPGCDCCAIVCQCTHHHSTVHVFMVNHVPYKNILRDQAENLFHDKNLISSDFYNQIYRPPIA
jgi:hypothetical protein